MKDKEEFKMTKPRRISPPITGIISIADLSGYGGLPVRSLDVYPNNQPYKDNGKVEIKPGVSRLFNEQCPRIVLNADNKKD